MRGQLLAFVSLVAGLLLSSGGWGADNDEALPPFPKVGSVIPGPFHVLNLTGDRAGRYHCLVCRNSVRPMAMVFVRLRDKDEKAEANKESDAVAWLDSNGPVGNLLKKLDGVMQEYPDSNLGAFTVFLGDELADKVPAMTKVEALIKEGKAKHMVFGWGGPLPSGEATVPEDKYLVNKEDGKPFEKRGVVVVLYNNYRVVGYYAFEGNPPTDKDTDEIVDQFKKMRLPPFLNRKKFKLD